MCTLESLFRAFSETLDVPWMLDHTEALWWTELGQRTREHRSAARWAEQLLGASKLEQVERLTFPADGETVCQDKTMPMAWDANVGRLGAAFVAR